MIIWYRPPFIKLACMCGFLFMHGRPYFRRWKCISWKASVMLAGCLSVYCRLRPAVGYAMASLRQQSAALVAGGSSRFCYQIDRVAEHLGVTLFKFMAGTLTMHCSVFSVHWQSHLLPMNGCVVRRRSPPPPPPEIYCRQITIRGWESTAIWRCLNYMRSLYFAVKLRVVFKHINGHFLLVLLFLRHQM